MKFILLIFLSFFLNCGDDLYTSGGVYGNIIYDGPSDICLVVCIDDDDDHTNGCAGGEYSTDVIGTGNEQSISYSISDVTEDIDYYLRALGNTEACDSITNPGPEYEVYYDSQNGNPAGSAAPDSLNFSKTDECQF